jgi:glucokinase
MVERDAPAMPLPAVLAFDLGGTRIKAGIVRGATVSSLLIEATNDARDGADVLAGLLRLGRRLGDEHAVAAVGISVKGIIDAQRGVILDVKERLVGLIGRPLAAIVARELGRPVVENDARMYALGEWRHGAGRRSDNMVCLTLGTGVGSGVVVGGRLLRGPRGVGGILAGHVGVQSDGPVCTCGNAGCLEALIGTAGFLHLAAEALARDPAQSALRHAPLTAQRIFEVAAAGDAPAHALAQRFATYLGAGIVTAIHAYDPDVVVLGGGVMHSFAPFLPDVQAYVDAHAWTVPRGRVRVVPAALGDAAALIGVAALTQQADQVWWEGSSTSA